MSAVLCVGHAVQDFVFTVKEIPRRAEKYAACGFHSIGGGPAANAAVTIAKLSGKAKLAARVGEDEIAQLIIKGLAEFAVDCSLVRGFKDCRSSLSAVLLDEQGERLIVNYLDTELPAEAAWLAGSVSEDIAVVLADTRWPQAAELLLNEAKRKHIPAILDADKPVPREGGLLKAASHITFSAQGLRDYLGHEDFERALIELSAETGAWCCVTLGAEGVVYVENGKAITYPAFSVTPVDTLGAGDVWHGAFALALAEQSSEVEALRFATAVAALKVRRPGGPAAMPGREELMRFLDTV